jgi:hypothetical protein
VSRKLRKWNVNVVTRHPLGPEVSRFLRPLKFRCVGMVEGRSWREAQKRALAKYALVPLDDHEEICVAVTPYEPTAWERVLGDYEPT